VKVFDIALRDLLHTLRTPFTLIMMFGAPLLIAGLLFFAFGSMTGGGEDLDLQAIEVVVANLDQPAAGTGGFAAGELLIEFLRSDDLSDLLAVEVVEDEATARANVDGQRADVAVIIPVGLSAAATTPGQEATVVLYPDPTLTIAPGIVQDLVSQFIDGFAGAKITAEITGQQFEARGVPAGPALLQGAATQYAGWLETTGHHQEGADPLVDLRPPATGGEPAEQDAGIIAGIMSGMVIFFTFFVGSMGAESIVREDEEGTLPRLFTTPTPRTSILAGKFTAILLALVVQVAVLLVASSLIFGITWGRLPSVLLVSLALTVAAAGFGIFVMSFVQSTRQTGPVLGSVLTLTGMLGGLFTQGIPNVPELFDVVNLVVPQGWAMRAWDLALAGAGPAGVLLHVAALLGMGVLFFAVGALLFRRRFA
jgi:ABC-2 type transport system permease protein